LVFYQSYSEGSYIEKRELVSLKISKGNKPAAYSYKANIEAPSLTEAPQYQSGDVVDVSLVTSMGKILLSTSTSTFPISVDYSGIASSSGSITMTYHYEEVITPATDTTPAVTEKRSRSFTRAVSFTEE
jgi:serine/threonine-protein kinase